MKNATASKLAKKAQFKTNLQYLLMTAPGLIVLFIWHYLPMGGLVLAFEQYSYRRGIFGSKWVGFQHFENFFASKNFGILLRNTIGYNLGFMFLVNIGAGIVMALLLYEVKSKKAEKLYNTAMILPSFISIVIISYIVLMFLNPESGILNTFIKAFGGKEIEWYSHPKYWPAILLLVSIWKDAGMASLYFYSSLLSIDDSLFEACELDGAGRLKQIWYVSVPELIPMVTVIIIMKLGSILGGDFGFFYQIPMDQAALYPATDIFATYIYRGIANGTISQNAAVGMFQSVAGLITVLVANFAVKKIDPSKSLF